MSQLIDHDVHVHTYQSACSGDPAMTPANIIARAAEVGLKTIGLADHMWDAAVPGGSNWYRGQDFSHVLRTRELLPADTRGVRVLIGCESEYCGGGKVGITRELAGQLDFVLLPISHFHMKGFVVPEGMTDPGEVARLLVQRFDEAVELGLATGIAHPMLPLGYADSTAEIISMIPADALASSFARAAKAGVSIEISTAMFPSCRPYDRPAFHDETFIPMLRIAKREGCRFHFASDAHRIDSIGQVLSLRPFAEEIGITPDDIHPLFRS